MREASGMSGPRVLIGAGGTAGHVVPALAVADALSADGADVQFIGGGRAEATLVPEAGYGFHRLEVVALPRRSLRGAVRAVAVDTGALVRCVGLVRSLAPDVVLGGGGYVAGPVGLAARLCGVPLVLTEIDSHFGLSNRLLAPFARRVCLGLPIAGREPPRYRVTGRPVPAVVGDRASGRARFGVDADAAFVVVFGGSLGARTINHAALAAFAEGTLPGVGPLRVLHSAGERDIGGLVSPGPFYDLRGYIPGLMDALLAADLVIARSGGSIFELAAAGAPSILIPSPNVTADHQTANARWLVDAGAAVMLSDSELTPERLAAETAALLGDPARRAAMSAAARSLARPDAAADIAAEVRAAAASGGGGGLARRR
jgi:UDP-N-acetylglucosamine--N-acetylmuramyl-(pentapeptide) pyrophosphoryl-undecaprenol N-acetylglucosamine transferase